jgi:hypothetical protein
MLHVKLRGGPAKLFQRRIWLQSNAACEWGDVECWCRAEERRSGVTVRCFAICVLYRAAICFHETLVLFVGSFVFIWGNWIFDNCVIFSADICRGGCVAWLFIRSVSVAYATLRRITRRVHVLDWGWGSRNYFKALFLYYPRGIKEGHEFPENSWCPSGDTSVFRWSVWWSTNWKHLAWVFTLLSRSPPHRVQKILSSLV